MLSSKPRPSHRRPRSRIATAGSFKNGTPDDRDRSRKISHSLRASPRGSTIFARHSASGERSKFETMKSGARMISQVHDELLFEVPRDEVKTLVPVIRKEMQDAVSFKVPMEVSVKAGPNWLDMEPCK